MSGGDLRYDRYRAGEWRLRIGPAGGTEILVLPPLLEEMNRCRALLVAIMRDLAASGFLCTLPDFPGTGESERSLETVGWQDWQDAAREAATPMLTISVRGGALLEPSGPCWRFAPAAGAALCRDLERAALAGGALHGGYPMNADLWAEMRTAGLAQPPLLRVVRLATDAQPADRKVEGPALWRRSEPGNAPVMAALLAGDICDWARQCGAC